MKRCRNAYDVFPAELVAEIQEHFSGGLLWIPCDYETRDREICRLKREGYTAEQIGRMMELSKNRVWEILKQRCNTE